MTTFQPAAIRAALGDEQPVTRFAPSPTGYLHLGHVAHMIYVWGVAQAVGGKVLLRIEDHDRGRCRPEYEQAILEDMDWLGFESANSVRPTSPYRQSDSDAVYHAALARLREDHQVYRCVCTRREIAEHSPLSDSGERCYSGCCRGCDHPETADHGLRVVFGPGEEPFTDAFLGKQSQDPSRQCGDLLLRDRHDQWTYQFAVTVDDMRHGVNLVVRGEDLLASTGRQIRLAQMLGRAKPIGFAHHPLIKDAHGDKLSKKQSAPPVRELRGQGLCAEGVLGRAAFQAGLVGRPGPLCPAEAMGLVAGSTV